MLESKMIVIYINDTVSLYNDYFYHKDKLGVYKYTFIKEKLDIYSCVTVEKVK